MIAGGLPALVTGVNAVLDAHGGDEARAHAIRALLQEYLRHPRFVSDCVAAVLERIEASGRWDNSPIHYDDTRDYIVRVLYWPGRYRNRPHEHLTWTVSGVLHGSLSVFLWHHGSQAGALGLKRTFEVGSGKAGCLVPPCIHSFENPGDQTAVSVHVIAVGRVREAPAASVSTGSLREPHVQWLDPEERGVLADRPLRRVLLANISMASMLAVPPIHILERCFDEGDRTVKLAVSRVMARLDAARGSNLVSLLADACEGPDRTRLLHIAERLAAPRERSDGRT